MESRVNEPPLTDGAQGTKAEKVLAELKNLVERAEEKAAESAKAADRVVRDHPYQTIGLAFGVGLLIGLLARRK